MNRKFLLALFLAIVFSGTSSVQAEYCADIASEYVNVAHKRYMWRNGTRHDQDNQCPMIPRPCEPKIPADPNSVCEVTNGLYSPGCNRDDFALRTLYEQTRLDAKSQFIHRSMATPLHLSDWSMEIPERTFSESMQLTTNWWTNTTPTREIWEKAQEIVFEEGCPAYGVRYDEQGRGVRGIGLLNAVRRFNKNRNYYYSLAAARLNTAPLMEHAPQELRTAPAQIRLSLPEVVVTTLTSLFNSSRTYHQRMGSHLSASTHRMGRIFQKISRGRPVDNTQFRSAYTGLEKASTLQTNLEVLLSVLWTKIYALLQKGNGRVLSADFNRDGLKDYAIQEANSLVLKIYLRPVSGASYVNSDSLTLEAGDIPSAVDVTGDGILDISLGRYDTSGLRYYIGVGDGTFRDREEAAIGAPMIVGLVYQVGEFEMCVTSALKSATNCFRSTGRPIRATGPLFGRFGSHLDFPGALTFKPYAYPDNETFYVTFRVISGGSSTSSIHAAYLDGSINAAIASYSMDPGLVNRVECTLPMAERNIIAYARRCVAMP